MAPAATAATPTSTKLNALSIMRDASFAVKVKCVTSIASYSGPAPAFEQPNAIRHAALVETGGHM